MLQVPIRVKLVLVRHGEDQIVVVQIPSYHRADRLLVVHHRRRAIRGAPSASATAAAAATSRWRVELVRHYRTRMAGLRVQANVELPAASATRHVHVEVLE